MIDLDDLEKKTRKATPVARLLHWIGADPYNKGRIVARTFDECAEGTYPDSWEEGERLFGLIGPAAIIDLIARCRKAEARVAELEAQSGEALFIVFDGEPGPNPPRFVEVETAGGISVKAGDWRPYGNYWTLGPLYLRAPQAVPEGWKLVPENPTDAMSDAAVRMLDERGVEFHDCIDTAMAYRSMLAAAPSPEGEK